ncbi:hypothetical protein HPP92_018615 [Vanilla planifolia]|uniref:BAHD acyltransferase DCR n=1 Tax=Vanilla planifolia TaxID=51239 RepID=A0A835QKD4_VANPL|nr:hypothetical protein HPP92_018615 [Vanilla planifolia]
MSPSLPSPAPSTLTITSSSTSCPVTVLSKVTVFPDKKSKLGDLLNLSVFDLPMLTCHYIQKGLLFPPPSIPIASVRTLLTLSLSRALSFFPSLAGRLFTDPEGRIFISCTDSAFQFTELGDGAVFLACSVNHAVVDGTSFWNFFNAWGELCRSPSLTTLSLPPDFRRNFFPDSPAVLLFPEGKPPSVSFPVDAPLRERIFHFGSEAIRKLKSRANCKSQNAEVYGKSINDPKQVEEISSFQSLCAQLWSSVTRARSHLAATEPTTFRMAVNCRRRVVPAKDDLYFGNAIQSIATTATVKEVADGDLRWVAALLHQSVVSYGDERIRKAVAEWEAAPRCFPLGNPSGSGITMGSSPRFPMYEGSDFGWGCPLAVRSGKANKFDGKISAFPGKEGRGSVDLEVCLAPDTMAALLEDKDFMQYVSAAEKEIKFTNGESTVMQAIAIT